MVEKTEIALKCIFCGSTQFEFLDGYKPKEDDTIKCSNCNKLNFYSDMRDFVAEEGKAFFKNELKKEIQKKFKNLNLKIKL